jgi:methionyl-tRNA formyltransferase
MTSETSGKRPRILLVGFGPTTLTALESLAERFAVVGVLREFNPEAPDEDQVVCRAKELGIEVVCEAALSALESLVDRKQPSCVVVSSYHRILPARIVSKCRFINVHYSLLPRYRGRANVNWAILNGEAETGISIHVIEPGLDAGNILFRQPVAIEAEDTVTILYEKLNGIQRLRLGETVEAHLNGNEGVSQNESEATYGCTRIPSDGEIDWSQPTRRIHNLVRALTDPYPGAFTYLDCEQILVWKSEIVKNPPDYAGRVSGRVVFVSKAEGFVDVLTGDGVLRLREVQKSGGERAPASSLITSVKATLGLRLAELLERVRRLEAKANGRGE